MGIAIKKITAGLLVCLIAGAAIGVSLSVLAVPESPPPFLLKWGVIGSDNGSFSQPQGVAVDATGNAYVTDTDNNRIQKFTGDGDFITTWGAIGSDNGSFSQPHGMAVDASGNVYVADTGNHRVQKFTGSGSFLTEWGAFGSDNGSFNQPQGLAVDAAGNVYVADSGNNRIQKFTGSGVFISTWGAFGSDNGSFSQPHGIAIDASDNVYVVDTGNQRIQKFTSSGEFVFKWGAFGSFDGQFFDPRGVAVDASGDVYVADISNQRLQKFTGFGTFITKWGTIGPGDGEFMYPWAVAVSASGNVYVADTSNSRIQVFGYPPPPSVTTNSADNISVSSARLNGRLIGLGAAASANVSFQWGTSTANLTNETATEVMLSGGNFSANLNSLSDNTTYYFRAKAVGNGTAYGSNIAFSTPAATLLVEVILTVNETITVSDSPAVFPPVILTVSENVTVLDTPQALPPVSLVINEGISVTDSTTVPPRLTLDLGSSDGGGPGDPAPGFTFVGGRSTDQGVFTQAFTANSDDGKADFHISQGTAGKRKEGDRLTEVSVVPMLIPPSPPADSKVIGLTYDFGPEGATFSLPITITIKYDPASIPAEVNEKDLVIAFYDKSTGKWVVLDEIMVDPITRTVSGKVSHFTPFTVIAYPRPAAAAASSQPVSEGKVGAGENPVMMPAPAQPAPAQEPPPTPVPSATASPVPSPAPTSSVNWWLIVTGVIIAAMIAGTLIRRVVSGKKA